MKISISVETEKTEQPEIYQGDKPSAAVDFLAKFREEKVTVVQCQMESQNKGEKRSLNRTAKGEEACVSLLNDIVAWLAENV